MKQITAVIILFFASIIFDAILFYWLCVLFPANVVLLTVTGVLFWVFHFIIGEKTIELIYSKHGRN